MSPSWALVQIWKDPMESAYVKSEKRGADLRLPADTSIHRFEETPEESLHLTELSATHRDASQAVPPTRNCSVKSTIPKLLPRHVTVIRPVAAALVGRKSERIGRSYEYASVIVADLCPLVTSTRRVADVPEALRQLTLVEAIQSVASHDESPRRIAMVYDELFRAPNPTPSTVTDLVPVAASSNATTWSSIALHKDQKL
jgi:hypothetical protein